MRLAALLAVCALTLMLGGSAEAALAVNVVAIAVVLNEAARRYEARR